jgi:hypothetical protein
MISTKTVSRNALVVIGEHHDDHSLFKFDQADFEWKVIGSR